MEYDEFLTKIRNLSQMGFVRSHRRGPTGIGKTLEDHLGIKENNISGPDFGTYELKSSRRHVRSMVTLFTKTPSPRGAIKRLVESFGYVKEENLDDTVQTTLNGDVEEAMTSPEDKELHVTVDALRPNSVGLQLGFVENRLYFLNNKGVEAYYDEDSLRKAFEKKYKRMIFVLADHKKQRGQEFFHYNEAYRLEGFGFQTFSRLIEDGLLKVDLRVGHYPDGRLHDHGTGFRVFPRHLPLCFDYVERIV